MQPIGPNYRPDATGRAVLPHTGPPISRAWLRELGEVLNRARNDPDRPPLRSASRHFRKATDEAGWIALAYSCTRAKAERMIREAREAASLRTEVEG